MRTVIAICAIVACAFFGPPVRAALHTPADHDLDQHAGVPDYTGIPDDEPVPNYGYSVGATTKMAQTFTVGLPGVLCHVQIGNTLGTPWGCDWNAADGVWRVAPSKPVVQIWSATNDGGPVSPVGGTVTLLDPVPYRDPEDDHWVAPSPDGYSPGPDGWTLLIDFTPYNIEVKPGEMYAIVLWASDSGAVSVSGTADGDIAGSTGYDYTRGDLWTYDTGVWKNDPDLYDIQFRAYIVPVPLPAGVWLGICAVGVAGWHLKRHMA